VRREIDVANEPTPEQLKSRSTNYMRGTVKKIVSDRGFGFIAADDGKEYFFHQTQTEAFDTLIEGDSRVSFEVKDSPKGLRAIQVATVPEPVAAAAADSADVPLQEA
jgi:CspA family cold shock protein